MLAVCEKKEKRYGLSLGLRLVSASTDYYFVLVLIFFHILDKETLILIRFSSG